MPREKDQLTVDGSQMTENRKTASRNGKIQESKS